MKMGQIAAIVAMSPLLIIMGLLVTAVLSPVLFIFGIANLVGYALTGEWMHLDD